MKAKQLTEWTYIFANKNVYDLVLLDVFTDSLFLFVNKFQDMLVYEIGTNWVLSQFCNHHILNKMCLT